MSEQTFIQNRAGFFAALRALIEADDPAIIPLMRDTRLCPFGGGRNGMRDSCMFGHPGCACMDWAERHGPGYPLEVAAPDVLPPSPDAAVET